MKVQNNTKEKEVKTTTKKRHKKGVNPDKFLQIMKRLDDIEKEIKAEEIKFDTKLKSLELEKQYLVDQLQPK